MSINKRSKEEYLEEFANDYCEGDKEKAEEHAIVKEVFKYIEEEEKRGE